MALVQIVQGAAILSNDLNQIIVGLDGTSAVDFTIKGAVTHENGAREYFRSGAGATISNELGVVGGTTFNYIGVAHASSTVAAATNSPMFNMDAHIRPNQTQFTTPETGASWMLKTVRYGSGSAATTNDGNLAAHYAFLVQAETDSIYTGYNSGHDEVAMAAILTVHGAGDARGGQYNSPGRGWAGYFEAINYSPTGQSIGMEIQVVNNAGATAAAYGSAGYSMHQYGVQLVSNANNIGATTGAITNSYQNTAAIRLASTSAVTKNAFRYGMVVETNAVSDYLIAAYLGPVGATTSWAFPPFVILGTGQGIYVRSADGTTDSKLIATDPTSSALNLYFSKSTGSHLGIGFVDQTGNTQMSIMPTGNFNFSANTSVIRAVQGAGVTPAFAAVTNGLSGFPLGTNPSHYIRAYSGATYVCWPAWTTT